MVLKYHDQPYQTLCWGLKELKWQICYSQRTTIRHMRLGEGQILCCGEPWSLIRISPWCCYCLNKAEAVWRQFSLLFSTGMGMEIWKYEIILWNNFMFKTRWGGSICKIACYKKGKCRTYSVQLCVRHYVIKLRQRHRLKVSQDGRAGRHQWATEQTECCELCRWTGAEPCPPG